MDLENHLKKLGIWYRFVEKPETIHTKDAAEKAGIELKRVTKSLILLDQDGGLILGIIPGDCKLSFEKIKNILNLKGIRLVPFDEAESYSGYPPGATPMIYHKAKIRVIVDKKLMPYETVFGGGGTRTRLLELKLNDVVKYNNAIVSDITQ